MTRPTRVLRFVDFCERTLALDLTVPWRVLLLVTIDGVQPGRLEGEERDVARLLFGDVDEIDPRLRRILVWRLGRASGKTTIAAALCIYCAWTATLRSGRGHIPTAFFVAPGAKLAKIGAGVARELVRGSSLERYVEDDTSDGFTLRRADGRLVSIRSVAASKGGANLRGVDVIVLVLDESEFFETSGESSGEGYSVNDRDQASAVMARLVGFVIFISTPWPTENETARLFDKNHGHPVDAVAALGPSELMRPTEQLRQDIAREMARDEDDANREFFCVVGVRGGSRLFDGPSVEGGVDDDRPLVVMAKEGALVGVGGDLGLERDSSVGAAVSSSNGLYTLLEFDEIRPSPGAPLAPRYVIVERFAPLIVRHGATEIMMDAHYRQSAIEHLESVFLEMVDAPAGAQGKYDTYMFVRGLLRTGQLRLPRVPRLLAQFKAVTSTPMPRGLARITSPRRAGAGHGDIVSAIVLACWQAKEGGPAPWSRAMTRIRANEAALSSPARLRALEDHRRKEHLRSGEYHCSRAIFGTECEYVSGDFLGKATWRAGDTAPTFSADAEEGLKYNARGHFKSIYGQYGGTAI